MSYDGKLRHLQHLGVSTVHVNEFHTEKIPKNFTSKEVL
jgi:hypothetical protein